MSYESDARPDNTQADEIKRLKKINDRLARIACKALTLLEQVKDTKPLPRMSYMPEIGQMFEDQDVKAWWPKHKAEDMRRKKREAEIAEQNRRKEFAKKRILENVSPEDLAMLGIKL
jgi:hypothetical protein